ncbi:MAG: histidinol-phosphate transaminase [Chloroflexota bacterium]
MPTIHRMISNENPLGTSANVVAAIQEASHALNWYPDRFDNPLQSKLADYHNNEPYDRDAYTRTLTADHFFAANGGLELLDMMVRTYVKQDDEVILCPPTFGWYKIPIGWAGGKVVNVPLKQDTFEHDVDAILAAITERTRVIFLCNPNNPSGVILTADEMARLVSGVPDHVIIFADEVYYQYVDRADFPDSIRHIQAGKKLILGYSASKAYGLAGLRLGYLLSSPALLEPILHYRRPFTIGRMVIAAGCAILDDTDFIQCSVALAHEGKHYFYEQFEPLQQAGYLTYWQTQTNFILFRPTMPAQSLAAQFIVEQMEQRGILVRHAIRDGLDDCIRITIGLPESNEAFMQAYHEILGE